MSVASIILAGGESRRMGEPKLLLSYQGRSLLAHTIHKAHLVSSQVVVVVGAYAELYRAEAQAIANTDVVAAQDWHEGQGASLRTGIKSLEVNTDYCYILLADQPFVPVEHLKELYNRAREIRAALTFSRYSSSKYNGSERNGVRGPPALLHNSLFEAAKHLQGQQGAKTLIEENTNVAELELRHWQDIDTPADAKRFLSTD